MNGCKQKLLHPKTYFVSSTENNISKFHEHRGSTPEDE